MPDFVVSWHPGLKGLKKHIEKSGVHRSIQEASEDAFKLVFAIDSINCVIFYIQFSIRRFPPGFSL
jgi:hypothetical protein